MNKGFYAICGTAFFVTFAVLISLNGPSVIAWALLCGGVSQFVAQDDHKHAWIAANVLAYVSMILCVLAAIGY